MFFIFELASAGNFMIKYVQLLFLCSLFLIPAASFEFLFNKAAKKKFS